MPAVFLGADRYRGSVFPDHHPLAIPRIATVLDLCTALGWLDPAHHRECPLATDRELAQFHDAGYIAALHRADAGGIPSAADRAQYGIGTLENPAAPGLFARAAGAVGGSILAADLAIAGHVVFHPAGGMHHGHPSRARGFCYFNDVVFALRRLEEHGLRRIACVDFDAHHGDGVQEAFRDDPRVHTVSIHEAGRWPYTGAAEDRGGGRSLNLPVPEGCNDTEFRLLLDVVVCPALQRLDPQAVVVVCGTDALSGDPLSRMVLSNLALWEAVDRVLAMAPVRIVLGGGGYNPWTLARAWTGLWGRLRGADFPDVLPPAAQAILGLLQCDLIDHEAIDPAWRTTLADTRNPGPVRGAIHALIAGASAGP